MTRQHLISNLPSLGRKISFNTVNITLPTFIIIIGIIPISIVLYFSFSKDSISNTDKINGTVLENINKVNGSTYTAATAFDETNRFKSFEMSYAKSKISDIFTTSDGMKTVLLLTSLLSLIIAMYFLIKLVEVKRQNQLF